MTFRRADPNADGATDLSDAIATLVLLFLGNPSITCQKAADANDNGQEDVSDVVYLLAYLFQDGGPPRAPFGACGVDPTADQLTCQSFAGCP